MTDPTPAGRARPVTDTTSSASSPPSQEVLRARAYLMRIGGALSATLMYYVNEVGPVEAAARIRAGERPDGLSDRLMARHAVAERSDDDFAAAGAVGARLLVPEDPCWPSAQLVELGQLRRAHLVPPIGLWVRGGGDPRRLADRAVSVVGSRAASGYGVHVAAELGSAMAQADVGVISGGAFGVDAAAHRGVLAAGGWTTAVLACGIDRAYPAAHASLLDRIAQHGLIISEYPPGSVPARHRFLERNRLIAALGHRGCVVVEAGARSGSGRTATDAVALGRHLMAVPGPITSAVSAGCHEFIRGGAELIDDPAQVLAAIDPSDGDTGS